MSVTAHIFILFREKVSQDRVAAIEELISNRTGIPAPSERRENADSQYGRFLSVEDADLWADVSADGTLNYLDRARYSKLLGEPSIEGRLYENSTLDRHWTESYPDGPILKHALTLLTLLAQPDIEWVWYTTDFYETRNAITRSDVHQLIDDFVRIGDMTQGRQTRFIWTNAGISDI